MTLSSESDPSPGVADTSVDVLHPAALDKLRQLDPSGRAGILQRVLTTYDGSLGKLLAQFATARETSDIAGLRHVAHTLRSSSASVGAMALAARCAEVEGLIREGKTATMDPALDALATEGLRAASAVRAMLGQRGTVE